MTVVVQKGDYALTYTGTLEVMASRATERTHLGQWVEARALRAHRPP